MQGKFLAGCGTRVLGWLGLRPGREAADEVADGGDDGRDTVAKLLFGGPGAFGFGVDLVGEARDGVVQFEGEGGDGGVGFVDLALGVAPKLAVFLAVFAALFGDAGGDVLDAGETFFGGHGDGGPLSV
jgi:hypothetical protein